MMTNETQPLAPLRMPKMLILLCTASAIMMGISIYLVFFFAPTEKIMGFVQKIFYFHVPSAWLLFLATFIAAVGSIGYLARRTPTWDHVGDTAVELAILFGAMVLITGPLWGRKAWGAYWVWDVRLTSCLVLILTLVACKIVRIYAGAAGRQIGAGLALFAVINSIFVYYSVDLWRGTHPPRLISEGGLAPDMATTYWICVLTFLLMFSCLFWLRVRLARLSTANDELHMIALQSNVED